MQTRTQQNPVSIKSLPMFGGHVANVSFTNLVLRDVKVAAAINFLSQNRRRIRERRRSLLGSYASGITIENCTGTAGQAGHFTCTEAEPCTSIVMRGVKLEGSPGAYTCAFASGDFEDCAPEPCDWGRS